MKTHTTETPDATCPIDHTLSNKEPLLPNKFAKLPLGSVRAHGWIQHQLDLMTDGMVGRLHEVSHFLDDTNGWFGTDEDGWEEQAYWFRGFYNLGILTDDERIKKESQRWIEAIIATKQEDGYFGPPAMKHYTGKNGHEIVDLWPHMAMIDALRSYWEVTNDQRIIDLLTDFFRFCQNLPNDKFIPDFDHEGFGTWRPIVQIVRAGDMLPHIYWLYDITGDKWLLDVATRFYNRAQPPEGKWLCQHVVNFTQRFRVPGNYYVQSHNLADLSETENWYNMHMDTWGQMPGGGFAADENIRTGKTDPKQGFETCAMAEFNKSFYILGQITGQALYADRTEEIIFNSFPASQTPDLKGLHYLTAPNQPQCDASGNHDYQNKGRQVDYTPSEQYRCCQHNVAMGWPYFVEHLWMAAPGNGLVAWMYGASEVTAKVGEGQEVTVKEETDYPFNTDIRLTLSTDKPVSFPMYLRVPKWCKGFSIQVNGNKLDIAAQPGAFAVIEREWKDGDVMEIAMPVELSMKVWEKSCNSVTVNRGPLSYSLRIGEEWRKTDTGTENWPDWEILPTTPWNYGLVYDPNNLSDSFEVVEKGIVPDQPWTPDNAPIEIRAKGKRIPNWQMIDETITDLQPSPIKSNEPEEEITLIPMGCARLRLSCFPVIGDGPDAREWKKVSSHEEAMQIRLADQEAQNAGSASIYEEDKR